VKGEKPKTKNGKRKTKNEKPKMENERLRTLWFPNRVREAEGFSFLVFRFWFFIFHF